MITGIKKSLEMASKTKRRVPNTGIVFATYIDGCMKKFEQVYEWKDNDSLC